MSKFARTVGMIAGVVAFAASVALTFGGTAVLGVALGTISAAAGAVSGVSSAIAAATAKQVKAEMRGSVSQIVIGMNMPVPYSVGRSYVGGMLVYDKSANGPDNYDRSQIFVWTAAGPVDTLEGWFADYKAQGFSGESATGFYNDYLWHQTRMGARPETAHTGPTGRAALTEWGSDYKLSGYASGRVTMEFDEDGKRWASGVPQWGQVGKWVKIYDPRLDSTYPGGSGAQRWNDESTWAWSENPALHALTYARGRFIEKTAAGAPLVPPVKILGVGLSEEAIDVAAFVELANVCEANGWAVGGTIYEAPGISKWDNLKRFLATAAAWPVWSGGILTLRISAPKTALDTLTANDLADGEVEVRAMKSWRERRNTIVPRYRSEANKWEYVQSAAVTSATYLTEDGEARTEEVQYDLCQDKDQAAELAAYELVNAREYGPITLNTKPRMMAYRPGEALELDIPEAGLVGQLAVIIGRTVDPGSGTVQLVLESETSAKHAFALGQTGTAPPTPTIFGADDLDEAVAETDANYFDIPDVPPVIVTADHTGLVDTGQLPRNVAVKLFKNGEDVTASADWSASVDSGAITATIGAATGLLEITALGSSSVVTIEALLNGVTKSRKLTVTKQLAAAPATGGGGGTTAIDTSFGSINSTSMATISDDLIVTVGSAGEVDLAAPLTVSTGAVASAGTFEVLGIWQWDDTSGPGWTDLGSEAASDPDATVEFESPLYFPGDGYIEVSHLKTGLTPAASEKFRLRARKASGTRVMYFSGTASAVGR